MLVMLSVSVSVSSLLLFTRYPIQSMYSASGRDVIKVQRHTFNQCLPKGTRIVHLDGEDVPHVIGHWILWMKGSVSGCLFVCAFDVLIECVSLFIEHRLSMPDRRLLPGFTIHFFLN